MVFETFSPAQLKAMTWWCDRSADADKSAIICDGAVRSGKTMCMGISFVCWAMRRFSGERFGMCGKSIVSLRRNLLMELVPVLEDIGFCCEDKISKNLIEISYRGRTNTFLLFSGLDEGSQALIQGVTLAGIFLDEVALMPRSFVEQAIARCSVTGSRLWFNCNPENPGHWFYKNWILQSEAKGAVYVHFSIEDNPALSREIIARFRNQFSGIFYRRFVLGQWVAAEGLVYDFFTEDMLADEPEDCGEFAMSCDYGTVNPFSLGLWGKKEGVWYRLSEFYYDSKKEGRQKTDAEYVEAVKELMGARKVKFIAVDPSAASFIEALRREGLPAGKAINDVSGGIRVTADYLKSGKVVICRGCMDARRELELYRWDEGRGDREAPVKANDHAMDDMRYFCAELKRRGDPDGFGAVCVSR